LEQLTPNARSVLKGELSKRRIEGRTENSQSLNEREAAVRPDHGSASVQPIEEFVPAILKLYHRHLLLFVKLTFPAVAIGTVALILSRHEQREIVRQVPAGDWLIYHYGPFLEATLVALTANLITWFAFCLSFATICVAVEQIESGCEGSISESFDDVRQRLGPFLRLSLLLVLIFAVVEILLSLLTMAIFWTVDQLQIHPTSLTRELVIYVSAALGLLVLSRFALAIPALILDDFGAVPSILRSLDLTRGKWLQLVVLVTKSLVGGYVAAMLPFWLARWIPLAVELPLWFPWCLTAASVATVTAVEPVVFIGFGLLYLQTAAVESSSKHTSTATV
jgi:hypothetical protein